MYGKYHLVKKQLSWDGVTWYDSDPLETTISGDTVEIYETYYECTGSTPPPTTNAKYELILQDSSVITAACDSSSSLTSGDVSSEYSSSTVSAIIGNCISVISGWTFFYYVNLTGVTIPDSVRQIGYNSFQHCHSLTSIGPIGSGASIEIPNSVYSFSFGTFFGCRGLKSVVLPNSIIDMGAHAFGYCRSLTSITIPNSVTSINDYLFEACTGLTNVTIPSQIGSIGRYAFSGCTSLTSITCLPTTPPTLGISPFSNSPIDSDAGRIYVPSGSVNAYKSATGWSEYAHIIQPIPT